MYYYVTNVTLKFTVSLISYVKSGCDTFYFFFSTSHFSSLSLLFSIFRLIAASPPHSSRLTQAEGRTLWRGSAMLQYTPETLLIHKYPYFTSCLLSFLFSIKITFTFTKGLTRVRFSLPRICKSYGWLPPRVGVSRLGSCLRVNGTSR